MIRLYQSNRGWSVTDERYMITLGLKIVFDDCSDVLLVFDNENVLPSSHLDDLGVRVN
jgi:hypothetical protein